MKIFRNAIPQLVFLLISSLIVITYITENVVNYQVVVFLCYFIFSIFTKKLKIGIKYKTIYELMFLFSVLFFLRAFVDLEIYGRNQYLFGNDDTVYVFLLFGVLLQFIFVPRLKLSGFSFSWYFFIFSLIVLACLYSSYNNIVSGNVILTSDNRIQTDERLGVIQYGHLGLTAMIMGIVMYMKKNESKLFLIISPLLFCLGFYSIIMSGTRSAFVALFVILILRSIPKRKVKSLLLPVILMTFFAAFSSDILNYSESLGASSAARVFRFLTEGGDQSSGRLDIWKLALGEILESPLFGVSCFIDPNIYHVKFLHNSFLEVTYSMGLIGLIIFVIINYFAIVTCIRIFKLGNIDYMCFAMLYIQYFTYTMFSESILRLPQFWYFLSMVICIGFHYISVPKKKFQYGKNNDRINLD